MDQAEPKKAAIPEAEQKLAFSMPAPHANRFFVSTFGGMVRIAFCEQDPGTMEIFGRSAVVMQPSEMFALIGLLNEMAAPYLKLMERRRTMIDANK